MTRVRQRCKEGWVALEKRWSAQRWVAYWYLNDSYTDKQGTVRYRQGSHVLSLKTKDDLPTKAAALKRWEAIRDGLINGAKPSAPDPKGDPTFQSFLNDEFIPVRSGGWIKATREKLIYFFNRMRAEFGTSTLTDINKRTLQAFLNQIATCLCHDTLKSCYIDLNAVFSEPAQQFATRTSHHFQ